MMRFVMICEAVADFRTASRLAERVICEAVDWIEADQIRHYFGWSVPRSQAPFLTWSAIKTAAREARVRVHGQFNGEPGLADAQATRRALTFLETLIDEDTPIDAVFLIRDEDNDPDRRTGLEQGRNAVAGLKDRVVIGLALPMREAWVLLGFEPVGDEQAILDRLEAELGFHPLKDPLRLTGRKEHEVRSPKRVLRELTADDPGREEACWAETPLSRLRKRGEASGLLAYLGEVDERVVPFLSESP